MTSFIIRYYFIKENSNYTTTFLASLADKSHLELISQNIPPDFLSRTNCIYMYQHVVDNMKIIAVAIESENSSNEVAWKRLKAVEAEFKDNILGKMTVLFNNCSLDELFDSDKVVVSLIDDGVEDPFKGELSLLSWNKANCESNFCYASLEEIVAAQMLSSDMPFLYGKLIYLQKLSDNLIEKNIQLQDKKSDFENQLIDILGSKLSSDDDNFKDSEELEKNIEWMAVTFTKIITHQNINRDGIKKLKTRMNLFKNHVEQDSNLIRYINIFNNMTDVLYERLSILELTDEELSLLREEYKATIDIIQSRMHVVNERTNRATQDQIKQLLEVNSDMQKKAIVYQYSAAMIEFIVLAYYSHTLWSHLAHTAYTLIPSWIQLVVVLYFSGNTVLVTHLTAEYIQGEHHGFKSMAAAIISLIFIVSLILVGSTLVEIQSLKH